MAETELLQILVMSHAIHSFILLSGATTHWALHGPIASHLLKFIELSALSSEACVVHSITAEQLSLSLLTTSMFRSGDLWEHKLSICYE